ncbi:MAG: ECF transporter S component [Eubacterium sp.]|nr:ECF transporter S component [Eubacterium sp.]
MNKKLHKITATAVFSAMIFVLTFAIKFPAASGYVHMGDSLLYLCTLIMGSPWGMIAGAIGEGFADVAGGYVAYAPATVIVKVLAALPFVYVRKKSAKLFSLPSVIASVIAGVINTAGYFAADLIISKAYAFVDIPGNLIQALASAVIFIIIALALDKVKILDKINIQ